MKMITISNSDFKDYINEKYYYVDKTLLIEELLTKGDQVTLLPRPRRFGKTLNLSTLKYYFDINEDSRYLFRGLNIEKSDVFEKHINKYPTIFLTLKEIKGKNWKNIYGLIKINIADLYNEHKYLLKSDKLEIYEKRLINKIIERDAEEIDYQYSLYKLSEYLYKHYGKEAVILLDEYDTIVNSTYDKEIYEEAIDFMRVFIGSTFKGNKYLYKGIITGILRIAKESMFSGANNIMVRTILDSDFSDKFGFTEQEVLEILKYYNLDSNIKDVREWYNGYTFGDNIIYNPFSIVNYVQKKSLESYWIGTGENTLIKDLINKTDARFKDKIDILIIGDSIQEYIEDNIVFSRLNNPNYLWSLLLFSGYLKAKLVDRKIYELRIPNEEVKDVYKNIMASYFESIVDNSNNIIDAILDDDIDKIKEEIKSMTLTKVSSHDSKENFYHGLYYGVLLRLETKGYEVISNRESGKGRYDIAIIPKNNNKRGYVVEFKVLQDEKSTNADVINMKLKKLAEEAIEQIEEKKYETELLVKGIRNITILGIAFKGKNVYISDKNILI